MSNLGWDHREVPPERSKPTQSFAGNQGDGSRDLSLGWVKRENVPHVKDSSVLWMFGLLLAAGVASTVALIHAQTANAAFRQQATGSLQVWFDARDAQRLIAAVAFCLVLVTVVAIGYVLEQADLSRQSLAPDSGLQPWRFRNMLFVGIQRIDEIDRIVRAPRLKGLAVPERAQGAVSRIAVVWWSLNALFIALLVLGFFFKGDNDSDFWAPLPSPDALVIDTIIASCAWALAIASCVTAAVYIGRIASCASKSSMMQAWDDFRSKKS